MVKAGKVRRTAVSPEKGAFEILFLAGLLLTGTVMAELPRNASLGLVLWSLSKSFWAVMRGDDEVPNIWHHHYQQAVCGNAHYRRSSKHHGN